MVGLATRQRDTYFRQAERLAKQFPELSELEKRMKAEGKVIVQGLRDQQMKFEEYERALIDKTLTSALAAVYLGAGESQPKQKMERAWPEVVSQLTPLNVFLKETKDYIDEGVLRYGDDSIDFADYSDEDYWWQDEDDDPLMMWMDIPGQTGSQGQPSPRSQNGGAGGVMSVSGQSNSRSQNSGAAGVMALQSQQGGTKNITPEADLQPQWKGVPAEERAKAETKGRRAPGKTWVGLLGRVIRYIANPAYSFFELGVFMDNKQKGYRLMRRLAVEDKHTCPDCRRYDDMGWQPIGSLPMPGRGCRCYDHCRCRIEYR